MFQGPTPYSPTPTRSDVVESARRLEGTPFRHQGRSDLGLDCVGLVILVGRRLGLIDYDVTAYAKRTNGHEFMSHFRRAGLLERPWRERRQGDIVLMHDCFFPCHTAIMTEVEPDRIIHAFAQRRKVVEEPYTDHWHKRLIGCFSYPGLD